jgi:hypothetical protein
MTTVTVIVVVLVLLVLAAVGYVMYTKQRSSQLQERFGPEYERAVESAPSRREAEAHLAGVAHRRDQLDVRDLTDEEKDRYTREWDVVQAQFVDEPGQALDSAERLVSTVMRERGYPVEDFDERADLVAADHPDVVQRYRDAHSAHERYRSASNASSDAAPAVDTEDLRQSFVHYRGLFAALVGTSDTPAVDARNETGPSAGAPVASSDESRPVEDTGSGEIRPTYPQETR